MTPCNFWLFPKLKRTLKGTSCSVIFPAMKNHREHYSLPHANAACQQLMLLTGGEKIHACAWRFKVSSFKHAWFKSIRFSQKKKNKIRSDTFLTDLVCLISSTSYTCTSVSACVARGPSALLCPGACNALKMALDKLNASVHLDQPLIHWTLVQHIYWLAFDMLTSSAGKPAYLS